MMSVLEKKCIPTNKVRYGMEAIIDLKDCNVEKFTRQSIRKWLKILCDEKIDMVRDELIFWDDAGVPEKYKQKLPHTSGISGVQFILTSSIVFHTLDLTGELYVNIFSCRDFDGQTAIDFTKEWFEGEVRASHVIDRGNYEKL
jgi:hypothetical protein